MIVGRLMSLLSLGSTMTKYPLGGIRTVLYACLVILLCLALLTSTSTSSSPGGSDTSYYEANNDGSYCYPPLCNYKTGFIFDIGGSSNIGDDSGSRADAKVLLPMAESIQHRGLSCLGISNTEARCNLNAENRILIVDKQALSHDGSIKVEFWKENQIEGTPDASSSSSSSNRDENSIESRHYVISNQGGKYADSDIDKISFIELISPHFGTIVSSGIFQMRYFSHDQRIPIVRASIVGVAKFDISSSQDYLSTPTGSPVEPASWFLELSSRYDVNGARPSQQPGLSSSGSQVYKRSDEEHFDNFSDDDNGDYSSGRSKVVEGPVSSGYIEFVLGDDAIRSQRVFSSNSSSYGSYILSHYLDIDKMEVYENRSDDIGGIEKVKDRHESASLQQRLDVDADAFVNPSRSEPQSSSNSSSSNRTRKHICIWASNVMDGQKIIWLNQISHLDANEFKFSWILTLSDKEKQEMGPITEKMVLFHIQKMKVNLVLSPFTDIALQKEWLYELPADGGEPLLSDADPSYTFSMNDMYRYVSRRIRLANYDMSALSPSWVKNLCSVAIQQYAELGCDIISYGNNRDSSADALITETARMAGIPTVTELLNLFADPHVTPDVIVSPSLYALIHPSLKDLLGSDIPITSRGSRGRRGSRGSRGSSSSSSREGSEPHHHVAVKPKAYIISPGVDAEYLDREPEHMRAYRYISFDNCANNCFDQTNINTNSNSNSNNINIDSSGGISRNTNQSCNNCFVIGFMARLAPEKNPGLFVMAAHHYYQRNKNARFLVIGDGIIKKHLMDLSAKLGLASVMHFAGWISSNLRDYLGSIDVMVNPSLRGWSETFCIANVEAMSMSIPVVTFAVGGVGEYVSGNIRSEWLNIGGNFSVSENAVIINRASPHSISDALDLLYRDPSLRESIGIRARQTVLKTFTIQQQMKKYTYLYNHLINEWS